MTPAICKECIDDNHLIRFISNQGLQHLGAHFSPMHKVVLLKYCGKLMNIVYNNWSHHSKRLLSIDIAR